MAALPDFVVQGQNVVVVKRHLTHDQREQGHSQRPDVRGLKQGTRIKAGTLVTNSKFAKCWTGVVGLLRISYLLNLLGQESIDCKYLL